MKTTSAGRIDVLLSPAEIEAKRVHGFAGETCVVFDVLRATSVIVTGLANGADGYIPVEEIADAVALYRKHPMHLLAGERDGSRITANQSGGVEFHLGNSPREHSRTQVAGRTIISTTTNGTRALRACLGADRILAGSFLNLGATARWLEANKVGNITMICAGTGNALALEDVLAAGALCNELFAGGCGRNLSDSAQVAVGLFRASQRNLVKVVTEARNARRLLSIPELRDDVELCLRMDSIPVVAAMSPDGMLRCVI
ncbi:MAG: 2-phosphosulfolactate phosphatase [Verrucomicrobia bacterium]|nr:2-phosphosulfolactate phosphatase [Verrucomicrobiota bacterium]